jgi:hypothetical protein
VFEVLPATQLPTLFGFVSPWEEGLPAGFTKFAAAA